MRTHIRTADEIAQLVSKLRKHLAHTALALFKLAAKHPGRAIPVAWIARVTGQSQRTVKRHLAQMREVGLLDESAPKWKRVSGGRIHQLPKLRRICRVPFRVFSLLRQSDTDGTAPKKIEYTLYKQRDRKAFDKMVRLAACLGHGIEDVATIWQTHLRAIMSGTA
jgi:DNA-binding transcriptional ArsR family regulator